MLERKTKFYKFQNGFILSCFLAVSFFMAAGPNACASEITAEAMIKLTNQSRIESGLENLSVNSKLTAAALLKAGDMLEFDYFDHTSPAGIDPWHWIGLAGYGYRYAGENLAIDFATAEGTHRALMESSSHRDNILNSRFEEIGVAVLKGEFDGSDSTIVVEMFASPLSYNYNGSEISEGAKIENEIGIENDKTKVELEIKLKPQLKPESESKFEPKPEVKLELDFNSALNSETVDVPGEKNPAVKLAVERDLNLLAMILAEKNSRLIDSYLASGLYFRGNNEVLERQKREAVLASADAKFSRSSENNLIVSLLSLILGAGLLFSLLIFKGENKDSES